MMPSESIMLIGSGPSLNRVDLRGLGMHDTIAFNRSWREWSNWGFAPTYHACLDPLSMKILAPELLPIVLQHRETRFFLHSSAAFAGIVADDHVTLSDLVPGIEFSRSLFLLTDFGNVGAISLQILAELGYRRILMVGVDGSYTSEHDVRRDANHFHDDYAAGRAPLTEAECIRNCAGWPHAAAECQRLGIEVLNASPGTALTCFATMGFSEGLAWLERSVEPVTSA